MKSPRRGASRRRVVLRRGRRVPGSKARPRRRRTQQTQGDCAICLAPLRSSPLQTLSCSHVFHKDCVQEFRRHKSTGACPLCREPLAELQSVQELKLRAAVTMARYGEARSTRRRAMLAEQAEEILREVLALIPADGPTHYSLGHVLHGKEDFEGAVAEYRSAVEHDRELAQDPDVLAEWTSALRALGDRPGALQVARELSTLIDPTSAELRHGLALVWYDLGELDSAISEFRAALRHSPERSARSADIHCSLGMALFDTGDLEMAIKEYRTAITCDPHHVYAHANLGNTLYQQGRLNGAIAQYRCALRCDHNDGDVSCNLGDALYEKGRLRSAIRVYRAAARRSPHHVILRCKFANALFDICDFPGAVEEYKAVLAREPSHGEAYYNLWYTRRRMRTLRRAAAAAAETNVVEEDTTRHVSGRAIRMRMKLVQESFREAY